jgi:hypothetical protein
MVITADCLSAYGSSILPRVAKLLREGQVDPNGLISHIEGGALPPPATKLCPDGGMVDTLVLEASA